MLEKKASFISANGRGMTKNLILIRNILTTMDYTFEYCLSHLNKPPVIPLPNEQEQQPPIPQLDKETKRNDRNKFAKQAQNIICADLSLSNKKNFFGKKDVNSVLLLEPYDYFFNHLLSAHRNEYHAPSNNAVNFKTIITYTPFMKDFAMSSFPSDAEYITDVYIPFAEDINNKQKCDDMRIETEARYHQIEGKKILAILTSDTEQTGSQTKFYNLDIKKLCDDMPDDWIIATNNFFIASQSASLSSKYANKLVILSKNSYLISNILYSAEAIVTDSSNYACIFSSTKKPFYINDYKDSNFTTYIKEAYPELFISELNSIPDKVLSNELNDQHLDFIDKFAPRILGEQGMSTLTDIICK